MCTISVKQLHKLFYYTYSVNVYIVLNYETVKYIQINYERFLHLEPKFQECAIAITSAASVRY